MNLDFEVRDTEYYLDNAATTAMDDEVVEAMQPFLEERYGNSMMPYHLGQESLEAVENAREIIARQLGCKPEEVFFTSGGTESNNWAVKCLSLPDDRTHIVTSAVEHASVLASAEYAEVGGRLAIIPVDDEGSVRMSILAEELVNDDVGLVSIQYGNNEVGTLQPVREIGGMCKTHGAVFHCDACQALGKVPINVEELGIDMLSMSAHKIHGPMGIGALYVRSGIPLKPLLHGGGHEGGMRSGTLNVPAIVGFGKAVELAWSCMSREMPRVSGLVDEVAKMAVLSCGAVRNGAVNRRLPHILSFSIPDVDASVVAGLLGEEGICVSTGSACQSKGRSHVLRAMGRDIAQSDGAIRVSFSRRSKRIDGLALTGTLSRVIEQAKGLEML
jgi:cysteine desulfurase